MNPQARYYVAIFTRDRRRIERVVDAIGPANAASSVLTDEEIDFELYRGMPTRDPWRGTRWKGEGGEVYSYEVSPTVPLGKVEQLLDGIILHYGVKEEGEARTARQRPAAQRTTTPRRTLPSEAADEIERLSNAVERLRKENGRLRGRITELVMERNAATRERDQRVEEAKSLRTSITRLQDERLDLITRLQDERLDFHHRLASLAEQVDRLDEEKQRLCTKINKARAALDSVTVFNNETQEG